MARPLEKLVDLATVLVAGCALLTTGLLFVRRATPAPAAPRRTPAYVQDWETYASVGHRLGPEDATVTIVEFGDYQCPFCRAAVPHVDAILRKFDDVAFVYRHFPLAGHPAARAAECAADQGRFWEYHHALFTDPAWQLGEPNRTFVRLARETKVSNPEAFEACLQREEPVPDVTADQVAALKIRATGTPTFLVNGQQSMGVLDSIFFDALYEELTSR